VYFYFLSHMMCAPPDGRSSSHLSGRVATMCAFTDGSYDSKTKTYSHGAVVFYNSQIIQLKGHASNKFSIYGNVAGEIAGVIHVLSLAKKKGIKTLTLYHDYIGISKWASGEWKAGNDLTQLYVNYVKKSGLKIDFIHVKAHTGKKDPVFLLNDVCDSLAKKELKATKRELTIYDSHLSQGFM